MKYIIVGLGNFGSTLAVRLTEMGHEVFGVDARFEIVEQLKNKISHVVALDTSKASAYGNLPIKDTDTVVVAIGEDVGASIITTALMKQHNARHIISRSINPVHLAVLESMGIDIIINPEQIAANMFAKQLEMKGVEESFELADNCSILEIRVPDRYLGKKVGDVDFENIFNIRLLAIKYYEQKKNFLGMRTQKSTVNMHVPEEHIFTKRDILVMMGELQSFENMIGKEIRD